MKHKAKKLIVNGLMGLVLLFVGCAQEFGAGWSASMKVKAQRMCLAVNDYAAKHGDLDKQIESHLSSIRMENFVIRKDRESFSFGDEWYFEPKLNRLYNPGYQVGSELTNFTINFENVGNRPVVTEMNMSRFRFVK
jgi:hypothetical protein